MQIVCKTCIFLFSFLVLSSLVNAEELKNKLDLSYVSDDSMLLPENPSIVSFGIGSHRIKAGSANGAYMSGIKSIENSDFGIYGRGELIVDEYKTGHFWSWNMALGVGYYVSEDFVPIMTVGKCFSNYSTCYFNLRHPTANDDDIDALYYGAGAYFKDYIGGGTWEVMADWSPYKNYNGMSIYIGYGFKF
ncbi:hypothetical protein [Aliivibrio wodanis]|uniref:hypothetical protein n=1 Tax=Aliivibrio wodanis TaxID=80852 RepID=UPI00406D0CC0